MASALDNLLNSTLPTKPPSIDTDDLRIKSPITNSILEATQPRPSPFILAVVGTDAAKNAKHQDIANQLGIDPRVVKASPQTMENIARTDAIDKLLRANLSVTRDSLRDPEFAEVAHPEIEQLGMTERLIRGVVRGVVTRELGLAGSRFRRQRSKQAQEDVAHLKSSLESLGQDEQGGFTNWMAEAAQIVGGITASLADPQASIRVGTGTAAGLAIGLAGGPFAEITVPAGVTAGATAGTIGHLAADAFEVEGGLAFVDMIEVGIDPEIASWLSVGVGTLNATLETIGVAAVGAPIVAIAKTALRERVKKLATKGAVKAAAARLVATYGGGVSAEVGTEVMQEAVNIAAEELGKAFSEGEFESITPEEIGDRLEEIATRTFKGMAVVGLPSPATNFIMDTNSARRAKANANLLDAVSEQVQETKLNEIAPKKLGEFVGESLKEAQIDEVFIPIEALDALGNPDLLNELGVANQVDDARFLAGDVRIKGALFSEHILQTDLYTQLQLDIRMAVDDMTAREAAAFEEAGLQEEIARLDADDPAITTTEEALESEVATAVEGELGDAVLDQKFRQEALKEIEGQVERGLGLDGLFRTARDAGLTDKGFASYLEARGRARQAAEQRQEKKELQIEKRRNSAEQKAETERVTQEVTENVRQRPVYAAQNGIGVEQLDRQQVIELLPNGKEQLQELPKQKGGRRLYGPPGRGGINPDEHAALYDYLDGQTMLFAMIDAQPEAVMIATETQQQLAVSETRREGTRIEQAIEALHNDTHAEVLALELNQLRENKRAGRVKASQVKQIARERMDTMLVQDIKPTRFLAQERREATKARQAVRTGDRTVAARAKFRQLANFQSAHLAYGAQAKIKQQAKFLLKFTRKRKAPKALPVDYLQAIRTILSDFDLGPKLSPAKRTQLREFAERKAREDGTAVEIPQRILDADSRTNVSEMRLSAWNVLNDTIAELDKAGRDQNKFMQAEEKQTREAVVDMVVNNIVTNLAPVDSIVETTWDKAKNFGREAKLTLLNTDTLVREIDGFKDLGSAYNALKRPYDRAITEGYQSGQVGYTQRSKDESAKLVELYAVWGEKETQDMRKRVQIPGVRRRMSHQTVLAVLLNSGNRQNLEAITNGGQFTQEEVLRIHDFASEKDWNFAQSVWDYLDTLWSDIAVTIKRRKNTVPVKVRAKSIETKFGTFKGGYYPLQFDSRESILTTSKHIKDDVKQARFGNFATSHTQNGHTQERVGSDGRPVKLDLFIINSHVDQVVYDLEVGDAVHDMYKVLYHKRTRDAFRDTGQVQMWEKLDLWFGDVVIGEQHYSGLFEKGFRWIRTGFTISKIGFNITTVMFQPLGILQTSAQIGKYNTYRGMVDTLTAKQFGPDSIWNFVSGQSGFMRQRQESFNREIVEAQTALSSTIVQRFTPGRSAEIVARAAFWGIIKMQRFVDVITWVGAKRKGMELFAGDQVQAVEFADRMVERSQATGVFGGRTQLERGTFGPKFRQSETVRAMVPLISYFMAKTNVAYERTKKTSFRKPGQVLSWATDMALLYTFEAMLVAMIRGQWPDDEEESKVMFALGETVGAVLAGVPFARDVFSEIEGFRGGGVYSSVLDDMSNVWTQAKQGEIDAAFVKSAARLSGTLLRIPGTSQLVKTGEALSISLDGDDVEAWEFIIGPRWDE